MQVTKRPKSWYYHIAYCDEPYCRRQRTRPLNRALLWFFGIGQR